MRAAEGADHPLLSFFSTQHSILCCFYYLIQQYDLLAISTRMPLVGHDVRNPYRAERGIKC